mmetsp:Transcript_28229/g.66834  ORF Transcript_28229/g.66834 Transcript_28229/m.66834 type:complete len:122 (+) Transcript_28229:33-398(+)
MVRHMLRDGDALTIYHASKYPCEENRRKMQTRVKRVMSTNLIQPQPVLEGTHVLIGDGKRLVGDTLVAKAMEIHPNCVVVGTLSKMQLPVGEALKKLTRPSTHERLITRCPCPVIIIAPAE